MSRYRMTARRFSGPLNAPTRNETQTADGDNRAALEDLARSLTADGFTVWITERRINADAQSTFHVLTEWHPTSG